MRRVLLIAYYYPPSNDSGAVRPAALMKYLEQFGWEPIVLTPRLPGRTLSAQVIETEYADVLARLKRKMGLRPNQGVHEQLGLPQSEVPGKCLLHTALIQWVREFITYPDLTKGWVPFARQAIKSLSTRFRFNAIISTLPPVSCHLLGSEAKRLLRCPWVADYRDLWNEPHSPPVGVVTCLQKRLEVKTLREADALVAVSAPWADDLGRRYSSKPIFSITNGFDPDDLRPEYPVSESFSITHTGDLYNGLRNPSLLFEALQELLREQHLERNALEVNFYGPPERWVLALAEKYGLAD